jgi:hypothetical protein
MSSSITCTFATRIHHQLSLVVDRQTGSGHDPGSDGLHTYSAQLAYDNGQFGDETVAARTALTALAPDGARLEDRRDRSSRVDLLAVLCVFVARCVREAAAIPAHPAPRWN